MRDYIKPCPFCGGTACLNSNYSYKTRAYFVYVKCDVCRARAKTYLSREEPDTVDWDNIACNDAINAWNMRQEVTDYERG